MAFGNLSATAREHEHNTNKLDVTMICHPGFSKAHGGQ